MDKRAETLEALSTYITSQRALLARTQTDIERLKEIRSRETSQTDDVTRNASKNLFTGVAKLSELPEYAQRPPKDIEWSLFSSSDPQPLRNLTSSLHLSHTLRTQPSAAQTAPLSPLQALVKSAKRTILDPVFAQLSLSYDTPAPPPPPPPDAQTAARALEHAKIRALQQRRLAGGGCALTVRRRGPDGVFVRRDLADESAEVDVDVSGNAALDHARASSSGPGARSRASSGATLWDERAAPGTPMDVDSPIESASAASSMPPPPVPAGRSRKLSRKAQSSSVDGVASASARPAKRARVVDTSIKPEPEPPPSLSSSKKAKAKATDAHGRAATEDNAEGESANGKLAKARSETFKLAWSVEEQHLLETLLEKYPDGEKNRWLQISKAMGGRRTPRQVASRVQKYFEKLKRFGLEAEGAVADDG